MGRQAISADRTFAMLRDHSQGSRQKLGGVAVGLVRTDALLVPSTPGRRIAGRGEQPAAEGRCL